MNRRLFFRWLTGSAVVAGLPAVKGTEVLRLQPNEKLVLTLAGSIDASTADRLMETFKVFAPGVPVVVLDQGMTLSKVILLDA